MQIKFDNLEDFLGKQNDIHQLKQIGSGTFSTVKLCSHKDYPQKNYALKIQEIENETDLFYLKQEIKIHQKLDNTNIIKLHGYIQKKDKFYIFLEHSNNNDLFDYIYNKDLTEKQKFKIFEQMCQGIKFIHEQDYIHRDLKPENILLTENFDAKICDFGWSCSMNQIQQLRSNCGTLDYNPPEIFKQKQQTKAIDIWALGLILYELHHQNLPFKMKKNIKFKKAIKKIKFKNDIDQKLKDLILLMLTVNPKKRPTIQQVLQHQYFKQKKNLSDYLQQKNNNCIQILFGERNINASQKKNFNLLNSDKKSELKILDKNQKKNILFQKRKFILAKTNTLSTQISSEQCFKEITNKNMNMNIVNFSAQKKPKLYRKFSLLENVKSQSLTNKKINLKKSLSKIVLQNSKFSKLSKQNTLL